MWQCQRGMRTAERREVNVLEMKCLISLIGVSRMDRVRNEEVHRRTRIERELVSRAEQRILRWFGHVIHIQRMSTVWLEGCLWQKKAEVGYEVDRG